MSRAQRLQAALVLALIVCPFPFGDAHAQRQERTAQDVVASMRVGSIHGGGEAGQILAGARGERSQDELSSLADSLVQIAVSLDPVTGDANATIVATSAVYAFGAVPAVAPFRQVFEKLVEIHQNAKDVGIASAALDLILERPDRGRALRYYRDVLTAPEERTAWVAVEFLAEKGGADGVEMLRSLYIADLVNDRLARERLSSVAQRNGWSDVRVGGGG